MSRFAISEILNTLRSRLRTRLRTRQARRELEQLEAQAVSASQSFRPQHYARAARIAAELGEPQKALSLYGNAIDGYIEAGQARAAEVLCRRVVDEFPDVVRARRTLALLALGRGDVPEAERRLHEYAIAARRKGNPELLRASLRMMVEMAEGGPVLRQVAEEMRASGDDEGARRLLSQPSPGPESPESPERAAAREAEGEVAAWGRWSEAVRAALLAPEQLRRKSGRKS